MFSGDRWARDLGLIDTDFVKIAENLRRRDQHQRGSRAFMRAHREIAESLQNVNDQLQELTSVLNKLSITEEITEAEADRRLTLLRNAELRYKDLMNQAKTYPKEDHLRKELLGDAPNTDRPAAWGDAAASDYGTGQERLQARQQYMKEQDAGLDQLAAIMTRTKNIAQEFSAEIDLHNEIIDDVGDQMESVNTRLIRNTQRTRQLLQRSDTCGLWIIIIALMVAIVVVAAI